MALSEEEFASLSRRMEENRKGGDAPSTGHRNLNPECLGAAPSRTSGGATKYGNKRKEVDGISFASTLEATRYQELKLMQLVGEISALQLQPKFVLQSPFQDNLGRCHAGIKYVGDFQYIRKGIVHVEDSKGMRTSIFVLKWKWVIYLHPHIQFREVRRGGCDA